MRAVLSLVDNAKVSIEIQGPKGVFVKSFSSKVLNRILLSASVLGAAAPALAQDGTENVGVTGLKFLAGGIAIGLAVLGGSTGQGRAAASAYDAIGRNPQAADKVFTPLLLGLALIEFQTIMAFIIAILLVI
jgi:F-type H+-transporting ATPase subunit c